MAESEELKSPLMKGLKAFHLDERMKEKSEKAGLKLNIQKMKIFGIESQIKG